MILEFLVIAALFGAFPVVFITRGTNESVGFVAAAVGAMFAMTYLSEWLLAAFLPAAWWYALTPAIKRFSERKKPC